MHFTSSLRRFMGRKYKKFDKKYLAPPVPFGNLDFSKVEGGLHRYELDFLEAAESTKDMLEALENDKELLSSMTASAKYWL